MIRQYQIRVISTRTSSAGYLNINFGITIPREIADQFNDVNFFIEKSGDSILLKSGAEIPNYSIQTEEEENINE